MKPKNFMPLLVAAITVFACSCVTVTDERSHKSETSTATAGRSSQIAAADKKELNDMHYQVTVLQGEIVNLRKEIEDLGNRVDDVEQKVEPHFEFLTEPQK